MMACVAPVVVKLTGVTTLRISTPTGNCYPNYFMLVPASGHQRFGGAVGQ